MHAVLLGTSGIISWGFVGTIIVIIGIWGNHLVHVLPLGGLGVRLEGRGGQSSCPPFNLFDGLMGHEDVIEDNVRGFDKESEEMNGDPFLRPLNVEP